MVVVKEQDEPDKQEKALDNLDPNKVLPDITSLINERDYLKDEVRTLREQLENENVRYTELKSLKHQQVGALTFKLAKAIRDKERALEQKDEIHKKYIILENKHEELTFQYSILHEKFSAFGRDQYQNDCLKRKRALSVPKMSCFAVTGVMRSPSSLDSSRNTSVEDKSLVHGGESSQPSQNASVEQMQDMETKNGAEEEHQETGTTELGSTSPTPDNGNESLLDEFRNIQKELSDVKKNMSIVQALNERLSSELEALEEFKKKPDFVRSISERNRKNACSSLSDFTDGKKEPPRKFVFPDVGVEHLDNNMEKTGVTLEKKEEDLALSAANEQDKNEMVHERREVDARENINGEESKVNTPDQTDGMIPTKHSETDFKEQLEKAMKELEDIRTDNRIMKHQIDQMAECSLDHKDFLRRTTDFTGQILKEMKEREDLRSRKASVESQPPLNVLGTRLDEIMKAVEDMTYEPRISPKLSQVVLATRPHSSTAPAALAAFTQIVPAQEARRDANKEASSTNQKKRHIHGKLSEASLYDRRSLTSGIAGLRKISEPLPKEWRSTETLSCNPSSSSFNNSLGYRDYIQRHIVMSSSAIAKIRDLTPEELDHDEHFIY